MDDIFLFPEKMGTVCMKSQTLIRKKEKKKKKKKKKIKISLEILPRMLSVK